MVLPQSYFILSAQECAAKLAPASINVFVFDNKYWRRRKARLLATEPLLPPLRVYCNCAGGDLDDDTSLLIVTRTDLL